MAYYMKMKLQYRRELLILEYREDMTVGQVRRQHCHIMPIFRLKNQFGI